MNTLIIAMLIALIILAASILILAIRKHPGTKFDASLKDQFLAFQSNLNRELSSTRSEVHQSKDLISQHTIKTIDSIKDMNTTIQKIIHQQAESHKIGESLKDLLQPPKLRGNYGEAILEEMLERVLPKGIWEKQYTIDGREQVDAVVKMKDIIIPIDAKFPRDDYRKYLDASTPEKKLECWKNYENAIKNQIKDIEKKYIKPEKGTSEFALMFIPAEATYYETITEKNYLGNPSKIYEFAQEHRVIPVSPNNFYAFLQIILIGVRNLEIIKSAKQVQEGLKKIQKDFGLFYKKYEEMGKNLNKAVNAYQVGNGHIGRYKQKLDSTLQLEGLKENNVPLSEAAIEETKENNNL